MRFQGLDLNLLVVLDTLLSEMSVSRAGDKLNLSQSATSSALARLREHFKDDLLVQTGRQMVATPRALQLAPEVRMVLVQIENRVLTRTSFDPASSKRHIRIMASDYLTIVLLADALADISREAPGLTFELEAVGPDPVGIIDAGKADFLIMPDIYVSKAQPTEALFSEGYVCVVDADNPHVGETLDFDQYLTMRHVVVQFSQDRKPSFEDWFVDRFGTSRSIELIASSYSVVPYLIRNTHRIATLHRRLAERFYQPLGLRILPPPLDIPDIVEVIQWHAMNSNDEALMWVKGRILQTANRV